MKKLLFFILLSHFCVAQDYDTIIKNAKWETTKLGKKFYWKKTHFKQRELFGANQSINILEISLNNKKVKFGFATVDSMKNDPQTKRSLQKTSKIAANLGAIAAVNAGFFDMKNGGSVDFLKINGKIIDTTRLSNVARLPFHSISGVIIGKNMVNIIKGEQKAGWEKNLTEENVLLTGPLLMYNGVMEELAKTPFNDNRHPRTCACVTNDKKLLLITVDGRSAESFGMTLAELSTLAKALNCKDAINFDGGGSTTMYIKGQPESGVVNYPSDNKLFDHAGERPVSNIFYVK
ncbi:MAG: phosphodiester glycosidase family protein [Emticicia sp.]|nr:phosphodiester glycosidase family protein [Emticicia sp.]